MELTQTIINFAAEVIDLLPSDPIQSYLTATTQIKAYFGYINYFIPITQMLAVTRAWLVAVGLYYLYQIVLRWIKAIE